ncbi:quinoprotein dehydrogenase-associated SoxYZ-like carrier [Pseudomonas syringae]|uniref:Sulfur oxidation protein SoxZ n=1 Tax=Pseudomonas syringae TaxID=317 RepID=A0A085UR33_PSESX|nr:quinoprotein dehydrogenase-associated SoxYZ-like carrier [Pseudomonas syringae]KFE45646.1 sulfur oxidation protein SoxZ [Pseudomonas syringae]
MFTRVAALLLVLAPALTLAVPPDPGKDPVVSVMWAFFQQKLLKDAPYVFDENVILRAPPFAEDARQVPIEIDARAYQGQVLRILAWAELNPLPQIVDFQPGEQVMPWLAIRIRIEQATPLRAAVLTRDGVWHIGSTTIQAAGGGCTAPSVVRTQAGWEEHIGEVLGGRYPRQDFSRLRLQISHPMDNGMVSGIPEFYLNHAELRDASDQLMASLELFPAVSENPMLGFDVRGSGTTRLVLRDTSGNEFNATVP